MPGGVHISPERPWLYPLIEEVQNESMDESYTVSLAEAISLGIDELCSPESDLEYEEVEVERVACQELELPIAPADVNLAVSLGADVNPEAHYHYRAVVSEKVFEIEQAYWNLYRAENTTGSELAIDAAQHTLGKLLGLSAEEAAMLETTDEPIETPANPNLHSDLEYALSLRAEVLSLRDADTLYRNVYCYDTTRERLPEYIAIIGESKNETEQRVARQLINS
ncbi:MAG: hypothetical protein KDA84_07020, partial [Planctomycetaceae bacterium]|nr:hypothetical protein [Planctomycetaceae bacterium]